MRPRLPLLLPVALLAACTSYVPVTVPVASQGSALPLPGGVGPVTSTSSNSAPSQTKNQSLALTIGEEKGLATYLKDQPDLLLPGAVIWVSTDEKVVTVDGSTGAARAIKQGNAIVLGISKADPSQKFTFDVTVGESRTVLLIKVEPGKPVVKPGEKVKLTAEVRLADGQVNGNVIWSSSDDTVATVNGTTGDVSALREGKVTILATYVADNKFVGAAEVSVVSGDASILSPSSTPSTIVFGPEATPIPKKSALPSEAPGASSESPRPVATVNFTSGSQIVSDFAPQSNSSNGAVIEFASYELIHINDDLSRFPENGDEIIQRGERLLVEFSLKNTGSAATQDLKALVSESDASLEFDYYGLNSTATSYNARIPGIHFDKMLPDGSAVVGKYLVGFGVGTSAPLGAKIPFKLQVSDTFGNSWTQNMLLRLP